MAEDTTIISPYADIDWAAVRGASAQLHAQTDRKWGPEENNGSADAHEIVDFYAQWAFSALTLGDHEDAVGSTTWPWTDCPIS